MRSSICFAVLLPHAACFLTENFSRSKISIGNQAKAFKVIEASSFRRFRAFCANDNENEDKFSSNGGLIDEITKRLYQPIQFNVPWKSFAIFGGGTVVGILASIVFLTTEYISFDSVVKRGIDLFSNVLVDIEESYVDEVDVQELLQAAVGSMLKTLDPYTEFENKEDTIELQEAVNGRYGGVGLVIAGESKATQASKSRTEDGKFRPNKGIQVVSAFEGYAFDAGMRTGDKLISVGGKLLDGLPVDSVRDLLRGPPGTSVPIRFIRDGVDLDNKGVPLPQEIVLQRQLVKLSDVKLASLIGPEKDGMGYIQLSGFSPSAGKDLAGALQSLKARAPEGLKGLILDLRGNPGGLLESAVEVAAYLLPENSDIVSAKGRAFGEVHYKSKSTPIRDPNIPLVVLTNGNTASAAEIVSGAVQDLDVGVIVGTGKGVTYGKGLVQNIRPLPYDSSLKYTVAKYYTPSGRCIQSVNYRNSPTRTQGSNFQSSGSNDESILLDNNKPIRGSDNTSGNGARAVEEKDRKTFQTLHGRIVKDGGGIEADVIAKEVKPSSLEVALYIENAYFDYAGHWAAMHKFNGVKNLNMNAALNDFKKYITEKQSTGEYDLLSLYSSQLKSLKGALSEGGLETFAHLKIDPLKAAVVSEMIAEFDTHKDSIRNSLESAILSRYLPESMVLKRQLEFDPQFKLALSIVHDPPQYRELLMASPQVKLLSAKLSTAS